VDIARLGPVAIWQGCTLADNRAASTVISADFTVICK
jgi:hypothetical protein